MKRLTKPALYFIVGLLMLFMVKVGMEAYLVHAFKTAPATSFYLYRMIESYAFTTTKDNLSQALVERLMDEDSSIPSLLGPLSGIESPYTLLPETAQAMLFHYYHKEGTFNRSLALKDLIEAIPDLPLSPVINQYLGDHKAISLTTKGLMHDGHHYGPVLIEARSDDLIYYKGDNQTAKSYFGPFQVDASIDLHFYTKNDYGIASPIETLPLTIRPFGQLIPLTTPYIEDGGVAYAYDLNTLDIEGKRGAVYRVGDLYILEDTPRSWSYMKGPESLHDSTLAPKPYAIIEPILGLTLYEDLTPDRQLVINESLTNLLDRIDWHKAFFLDDLVPSQDPVIKGLKATTSFRTIKNLLETAVAQAEKHVYIKNNLLATYIEDTTILYLKLYNPTNYKEGIRMVFGETYANLYHFKENQLDVSLYGPLVAEHYEETPLLSAALDQDPRAYREKIQAMVPIFEAKGTGLDGAAKDAALAKSVGDYLVNLITYDRAHILEYDSHTAFKALDQGLGVCESYASLAHDLLNQLGVETYFLHCDDAIREDDTHAYNLIKIGDTYRLYDFTWADKVTYVEYKYYGFDIDDHPFKPYVSQAAVSYLKQLDQETP